MPPPWLSWTRRSLPCKSEEVEVHEPRRSSASISSSSSIIYPISHKSTCSTSFSTLKDVLQCNAVAQHRSSSFLNNDRSVLSKNPSQQAAVIARKGRNEQKKVAPVTNRAASTLCNRTGNSTTLQPRRRFSSGCTGCDVINQESASCRSVYVDQLARSGGAVIPFQPVCPRCGQRFSRFEALELHHAAFHAVTMLRHDDSSRNIVEIIFRTSWLKKDPSLQMSIQRILKIHSSHRTISKLEEYRDMVKAKAAIISSPHMQRNIKQNSRCIADGNELLRFHATTLDCSLGSTTATGGATSCSLCATPTCKVCNIIRSGFSTTKREDKRWIHTTATSGRAHTSLLSSSAAAAAQGHVASGDWAMIVCRVIAGRVYKAHDNIADVELQLGPPDGYDSIAGALSAYANVEDLYVFNPRAILPCFVVIYRC